MSATISVLGNCAIQTAERETTSFLVDVDGFVILVDCGPSVVRQIRRCGRSLNDLDLVIITHSHGDHSSGYPYLEWSRNAEKFFGKHVRADLPVMATRRVFEGLQASREFMFPGTTSGEFPTLREVSESNNSTSFEFEDIAIRTMLVQHSVPTFAICIQSKDHKVCYSSDTILDESLAPFVRDADLLIHEAFSTQNYREMARGAGHSTAADAGRIAQAANAKMLALAHAIEPEWDNVDGMLAEAAESYSGPILMPADLTEIRLRTSFAVFRLATVRVEHQPLYGSRR